MPRLYTATLPDGFLRESFTAATAAVLTALVNGYLSTHVPAVDTTSRIRSILGSASFDTSGGGSDPVAGRPLFDLLRAAARSLTTPWGRWAIAVSTRVAASSGTVIGDTEWTVLITGVEDGTIAQAGDVVFDATTFVVRAAFRIVTSAAGIEAGLDEARDELVPQFNQALIFETVITAGPGGQYLVGLFAQEE